VDRAAESDGRPLEDYRDYLQWLARMHLGQRLRTKLDASDIVQQAILHAHTGRAQFRGSTEAEWLSWLRTILANALAAAARQFDSKAREVRLERSLEAELELSSSRLEVFLAADQTSPSEQAVRCEELLRLARAMARLSEDHRVVVELHHLKGLPVAEVARQMGRTRSAVVGLLYRGLKQLRDMLREQREGES
jgi:RNA polymerase sigma-70 factor, ECF subfamily